MFVLDTNVLSAMMQAEPAPRVAAWIAGCEVEQLFTVSVCQAEILAGLAIMPRGRRRDLLGAAAEAMFSEDFAGRVLPFDSAAATAYAEIFAQRRATGRATATMDLMIASVARAHGASVVTRDRGGFEDCGVILVDPWTVS